ncbi:Uncharacterized protein OBRU01_09918 [Operophtera brumata]|uniref:Uncharacterized protein n=1 Tax=Operophtera brumata TaxID=104452 RepID=A0A0L7LET0_OPEBR|nr:Uncharacterized protein OBRU01_09918 [Operophtera brumata]
MKCFQCEDDHNDDNTIQCDGCKRNICLQCSSLTSSEARVMGLKGKRTLLYLCPACREALFQVPKLIKSYDGLRQELDEVKIILSQPRNPSPLAEAVVAPVALTPPPPDTNAILEELVEREHRATNVILVGVEEFASDIGLDRKLHDESSVSKILQEVNNGGDYSKKVVSVQRLGRREDGKTRPIKVVLTSRQDAVLVLKNKSKAKKGHIPQWTQP